MLKAICSECSGQARIITLTGLSKIHVCTVTNNCKGILLPLLPGVKQVRFEEKTNAKD